ncbi:MAG: PIG-L family deacetylase [Acidimicrobiales bacterium]
MADLDEAIWGVLDPAILERIVVVSPHFDDAVLGASDLLGSYPGSTVITVVAGWPPQYPDEVTEWDACGGFVTGDDVVAARRAEDVNALAVLKADHVWLDVADHQYRPKKDWKKPEEVAPSLRDAIEELAPTAVFLPMGIANPDHVLSHDAGVIAREQMIEEQSVGAAIAWFCYEDHGYKHIPGMLAWRVTKLFKAGLWPSPAIVPVRPDMDLKRRAIACYVSQVPPLEKDHALSERLDANVPEQYWRLAPPPPGWEALIDLV